jgi:hypothetical protein
MLLNKDALDRGGLYPVVVGNVAANLRAFLRSICLVWYFLFAPILHLRVSLCRVSAVVIFNGVALFSSNFLLSHDFGLLDDVHIWYDSRGLDRPTVVSIGYRRSSQ